ncbi:hypothetical protein PV10_01475 [Exophiala mesophila]|uniref:Uncharacterized protein n=1 Tax=Exophiala mesophila TaxID=212818 RepID=A0A0D1ZT54_EXOME|nr:uncharacterized protein PV10_01475 [Exophiala mesophila]KIV97767.1 hypothetical protein PV10_01475 [Exophiala mesophila]
MEQVAETSSGQSATPTSDVEVQWHGKYLNLCKFPPFESPVPSHVTVQELIRDYPNHIRDEYIDEMMQHHYTPNDLWYAIPQSTKDLWEKHGLLKNGGFKTMDRKFSYRMKILGDDGMLELFEELEINGPRRQSKRTYRNLKTERYHRRAKDRLRSKMNKQKAQIGSSHSKK